MDFTFFEIDFFGKNIILPITFLVAYHIYVFHIFRRTSGYASHSDKLD